MSLPSDRSHEGYEYESSFDVLLMKPSNMLELSLKHHIKNSELSLDYTKSVDQKERLTVYLDDNLAATDFASLLSKLKRDLAQ